MIMLRRLRMTTRINLIAVQVSRYGNPVTGKPPERIRTTTHDTYSILLSSYYPVWFCHTLHQNTI